VSRRLRVAVLSGGRSSEHAISLASAAGVVGALDPERYDVNTIEIGRDGRWALPRAADVPELTRGPVETLPVPSDGTGSPAALGTFDVVLVLLHGPHGEDGTVQGLLELAGIPYVGPGVLASALCMDKDVFKQVMRAQGIPVARHVALRLGDPVVNPFGYPVFVKPARLGSSVGISKVRTEDELADAVERARRHDEKVLVEEFVPGMEIEVAVLGNLPSPIASLPGQVVSHLADWYDTASKYDEGGSELVVPPPGLTDAQIERAQQVAVQAFVATDCEGMARADFFVREHDGEIVMNELNTIPGFTGTSFYTRLFEASGWTYAGLLDRLIELALERHERRSELEF
jgi:D-alanine-D-alanine ligase